jgi:hypothetical protein
MNLFHLPEVLGENHRCVIDEIFRVVERDYVLKFALEGRQIFEDILDTILTAADAEHEAAMQASDDEHEEAIDKNDIEHDEIVEQLEKDHKSEISKLKGNHQEAIEQLEQHGADHIEILEERHAEEIRALRLKYEGEIQVLRNELFNKAPMLPDGTVVLVHRPVPKDAWTLLIKDDET